MTDVNKYVLGKNIRVKAVFRDAETNGLIDPTQVFLRVRNPTQTSVEYNYASGGVLRLSSGTYYREFVPNDAGTWFYHYFSSGSGASADQHYFEIEEPNA